MLRLSRNVLLALNLLLGAAVAWSASLNHPKLALLAICACLATLAAAEELYPLGPDSQPRDVPRGMVTHHVWAASHIFPGTVRDYWVYVPAQYKPEKPACVMIFQDGGGFVNEKSRWRIPVVFDNLIQDRDMPVTIGIFINPGFLPPPGPNLQGRSNRSFEYDAVTDLYARFLTEEILPEVGKRYNLSKDPNDYALCGASSGGICAFTAAWFRPDALRRVLSFVGSFTNLRGGDVYPALIRKSEVKPIRAFLQSGKKDMNIFGGNWYFANQAMGAAFEYMGYDYKLVLGEEGHNDLQGGAILPDALRWLWRDHPQPIAMPEPPKTRQWATDIVVPGKGWEPVGESIQAAQALAADNQGDIFVADAKQIVRLGPDSKPIPFKGLASPVTGMAFGPDGRLYACQGGLSRVVAYAPNGTESIVATGGHPFDVAADKRGGIYFTDPDAHRVWYVDAKGEKRTVTEEIGRPGGLHLSSDGAYLMVGDTGGRWVWSLQVAADGSLANGEPFGRLEVTDESWATGSAGIATDSAGFAYAATKVGIQLCDTEGRTAFIIANPPGNSATSIAFGGPDRRTLYAIAGGKVFRRPLLSKGG